MKRFEDKVVIITGGNSGIGLATAKRLQSEGASVAITGRSPEKLKTAVEALGGDVVASSVDMASLPQIKDFIDDVAARHGRIDVIIANAGGATVKPFEMMDEATFDDDMNRNFKGAYFTAQAALPHMKDGGSIVFLGSPAGSKGFGGMSVYGPAKAAVRSLVRVLASELAPKNIRANAVSPGPIPTPGMDRLGLPEEQIQDMKDMFVSDVPLGRMGTVDEIAAAIAFIASDEASYVTGVELFSDGGHAQV